MKIHILFNLKKGPWGGGNQFLKSLKKELIKQGKYTNSFLWANIIIFNSHHNLSKVKVLKKIFPGKTFIHRVDGPVYKIRNMDLKIDREIYKANAQLADGTIFQSNWSREHNYLQGMQKKVYETVIINAPDQDIFNNQQSPIIKAGQRIKLIATSWSSNKQKGFDYYGYLDENLDFSRFDFTFVGNSPISFKKINMLAPLASEDLAAELKRSHIFITASENDPCSNSLIEAMHCGLPALALNSGGHPEIIKNSGILFNHKEEIIPALNQLVSSYQNYQKNISLPNIQEITRQYSAFAEKVRNTK
jgi:glycosyltransferase involved in cell wall biosynthesis